MIYTHIFLVVLATVFMIIFAEYQKLRKITWILIIGCVTYIILIIEPKSVQISTNDNVALTTIDSTIIANADKKPKIIDPIAFEIIREPNNINQIIPVNREVPNLDIVTIAMAKEIVNKMPVGVSGIFLNDVNILFCFTAVDNAIKDNKIIHTWKHNKQDYLKSFIRVGDSPHWRCWSKITVRPEMTGDWQVTVTDTVGNYLDSVEFSILPKSE